MEIIPLTCPNCGASIEATSDREKCYCQFCGTAILVHDGSYTVTHRTIDEARVVEAQSRASIESQRAGIESLKTKVLIFSAVTVGAVGLLAGIVAAVFENGNAGLLAEAMFLLLLLGGLLYGGISKTKAGGGQIAVPPRAELTHMPLSSSAAAKMDVDDLVALLEKAGFSNIEAIGLNDLSPSVFTKGKIGKVIEMTVDGERVANQGKSVPKNAHVAITYHSEAHAEQRYVNAGMVDAHARGEYRDPLGAGVGRAGEGLRRAAQRVVDVTKRLIPAVLMILILLFLLRLTGRGVTAGADAQAGAQGVGGQAVDGDAEVVSVDGYSVRVPSGWRVADAEDGKYVYPEYGGMLYMSEGGVIDQTGSQEYFYDTFVAGMLEDERFAVTGDSSKLDMDGAVAFMVPVTYTDGVTLEGWLELILSGDHWYAVMLTVEDSVYEERSQEVMGVLGSIQLADPREPVLS